MSEKRFEWKVGLFVLSGLVLLALLMLSFSKGVSLFKPTYELKIRTTNVGGIKPQAKVLMSGVEVGTVVDADLSPDGKSVVIIVEIYKRYKIWSDAEFIIDSIGFLGDQYIAIRPKENEGKLLQDGDEVTALEPFNFQEVARASLGFINRLDQTAQKLSDVIGRIDKIVLNEEGLTNLSVTISNFRQVSERAIQTVNGVDKIFASNQEPIRASVSNLVEFSQQLNKLADQLSGTVVTNQTTLTAAANNLEKASQDVKLLLDDVQDGKGLIGGLLKDENLKREMHSFFHNANSAAANFSQLGSNINNRGIWSTLWKPKEQKSRENR